MAISSYSSGVVATTVLALLLLPVQYLVPRLELAAEPPPPPTAPLAAFDQMLAQIPPFDLFVTTTLLLLALLIYLCEWIQRKIIEKRIIELNQYLSSRMERLREWDQQQEELEMTLKLVKNATAEYNLLLYLLLRHHRCIATNCPPSNCFFDKGMEDISVLSPTDDV